MTRLRTLPALAALAALGACAAIPTSGEIGTGDTVVVEPGQAIPIANDPGVDAEPEEIVKGFLQASAAGFYDDFTVARRFLTASAANRWDPREAVIVFPLQGSGPEITRREDGSVLVSVPVSATVDAQGRYTEAVPGSIEEVVLEVAQDLSGQWRISGLENGVVMASTNFMPVFRATPVYFASTDRSQLVPDLRWFPSEAIATSAVSALLDGPSPWLRDAVVSGAPEGVALSAAAVTVGADRVATMDLTAEGTVTRSADRNLLQAQVEAMLLRAPGIAVTDVRITVGGLEWETTATLTPERDVSPGPGPYVIWRDRLALVDSGAVVPLADAPALTDLNAHSPAVSMDGEIRVVLSGSGTLLHLPRDGGAPVPLAVAPGLVAPSIDRLSWVWTTPRASDGTVIAVQPGAEPVTVAADWLEGRTVRSLRLARDGSRAAVVSVAADGSDPSVDVAAVVRDDDGTPQLLSAPTQVGATLTDATEVAWVDEVTVAVLGISGSQTLPALHLAQVGGATTALSPVDGATAIAAGRGDRALYLVNADGTLYVRRTGAWVEAATGVRDPVFPG